MMESRDCSLSFAANAIGGKWKSRVLYTLLPATMRYGELRRAIPAISERMLAIALRDLEEDGLIKRTSYAEVPPRVEYALTDKGRTLEPLLIALRDWGRAHLHI